MRPGRATALGGGPTSEVGLHQGSALSPHLFLLLMDVLTEDVRKDVHGLMMFADDIVLCGDDETDMTEYLETWRRPLEDRGTRISIPETKFINLKFGQDSGQGREPVNILMEELQRVHHFKYLVSSIEETGGMTTYSSQRVSVFCFEAKSRMTRDGPNVAVLGKNFKMCTNAYFF